MTISNEWVAQVRRGSARTGGAVDISRATARAARGRARSLNMEGVLFPLRILASICCIRRAIGVMAAAAPPSRVCSSGSGGVGFVVRAERNSSRRRRVFADVVTGRLAAGRASASDDETLTDDWRLRFATLVRDPNRSKSGCRHAGRETYYETHAQHSHAVQCMHWALRK